MPIAQLSFQTVEAMFYIGTESTEAALGSMNMYYGRRTHSSDLPIEC